MCGFSLVEVLVTLLILGVGLLGLAALQIEGLKANDSALMRTRASLAAYDLADRLRADPQGFLEKGQSSTNPDTEVLRIGVDGCRSAPAGSSAWDRWVGAFCGLALPPPSLHDFARLDCVTGSVLDAAGAVESGKCGAGNCGITIRWCDDRSLAQARDLDRSESPCATGGETRFWFCTRIPAVL